MERNTKLAEILVSRDTCSTEEEAEVIADIVLDLEEIDDSGSAINKLREVIIRNLIDNLGIEEELAHKIFVELKRSDDGYVSSTDEDSDESENDDGEDVEEPSALCDDDSEDGDYLLDGECELCDRFIKLTRHHLIPRSTWPRMQTRLLQAAVANENGDRKKSLRILGHGLEYLLEEDRHEGCRMTLSSDKAVVRAILHETCDICRQCHSTVHRTHTNMDLALYYNSVEKLLGDERISKFCKWASKQRTGKYKRSS